jgi:hypothetical protein
MVATTMMTSISGAQGFHSLGKYWEEWEAKVAQDMKMDQQEPN